MITQQTFPVKLFYASFILSILVCLLDLIQIILIGVFGFIGFDSSVPITITCLTTPYWLIKFFDLTMVYKIIFVHGMVSVLCAIAVVVLMVVLLVRVRNNQLIRLDGAFKIGLYLLSSLVVYCAIIPAGFFMTYYQQISQCFAYAYNSTHLLILLIIGILVVGLGLVLWVLLLCIYSKQTQSESKYREESQQGVKEQNKEQYQQRKDVYKEEQKNTMREEKRVENQYKNYNQNKKVYEAHEQTQQNLYDSPSRRPVGRTYSKDPEYGGQPQQQQYYHHKPYQNYQEHPGSPKNSPKNDQEQKIANQSRNRYKNMPVLEPRDNGNQESRFRNGQYNNRISPKQESQLRSDFSRVYNNQSRFRNSPPRSRVQPNQQQQGLIYHKKPHPQNHGEEDSPQKSKYIQSLMRQSKQYLNQRGQRSILDSSGQIQQRQRSDYYRSGNTVNNNQHIPHHRRHGPERQGVLLNYIRGKYAG